jgi:hypothetical protein
MKIKVTTYVHIPEKIPGKGELQIESGETLGDALIELSSGSCMETLVVRDKGYKTVAIDEMWEVRVNGRACYSFPEDLDIPLNPGDVVTLWLTPLGGGQGELLRMSEIDRMGEELGWRLRSNRTSRWPTYP